MILNMVILGNMNIKYLHYNDNFYIYALDKGIQLGVIVLDINCIEYPRYKEYCNGNKFAKIVRVETNPNYVGKGIASKLINLAINKFNDYNFVLLCSPSKRNVDNDTLKTPSDLMMFYSKFGFVRTNEFLPTMIRKSNI